MVEDDDFPAARYHLQRALRWQFGQSFHWICHGRRLVSNEQIGSYTPVFLPTYTSRHNLQSREERCDRFNLAALAVLKFWTSSRSRPQFPEAIRYWSA